MKITLEIYYHLKNEVLESLASVFCHDVVNAADVRSTLLENPEQVLEMVKTKTAKKIEELGLTKADKCLAKFPSSTTLERVNAKKDREACLKENWQELISQAIDVVFKDFSEYNLDRNKIISKMQEKANIHQEKIIFKKFN